MIIVAGALHVAPEIRATYLEGCVPVVELARESPGCHDFAISADLVDPSRINVLERWASADELAAFRGSGPDGGQLGAIRSADVREFEVSGERPA